MGWATFWANFSQIHLVTLPRTTSLSVLVLPYINTYICISKTQNKVYLLHFVVCRIQASVFRTKYKPVAEQIGKY
jgi:hypothetical protein